MMMMEEIMVENTRNNTEFENLPQHLIHHIMNYVPYNDAVKFSVLSKTLHSMWLSFPVLDFDYTFFSSQHKDRRHAFLSFILETLHHRCPHRINKPLQRLRVKYSCEYLHSFLNTLFEVLLNIAIKNHAKEIIFDICTNNWVNINWVNVRSDSLLSLFSSQFLTVLDLKSFRFLVADSIILCPKLKELVISSCKGARTITVSSPSVEKVEISFSRDLGYNSSRCSVDISACLSLKVLKLARVTLTDECVRSTISDLSCLKELAIKDCNALEKMELKNDKLEILSLKKCSNLKEAIVEAPKLLKLEYQGSPQVHPMQILANKFSTASIKLPECKIDYDLWFGNLKQFLSCFDHFKDLTISCSKVEDLIIPVKFLKNNSSLLRDAKHIKVKSLDFPQGQPVRRLVESLLRLVHKPLKFTFVLDGVRSTLKFEYENKAVKRKRVEKRCCFWIPTKCWRHYALKVDIQGVNENERGSLDKLFFHYMP